MILIKHFKNSVHTSIILSKLNNGKFNFFDFLRIFFIRFFFAFSFIRNLKKLKIINEKNYEELYFENKINIKEILSELENNGFNDELKLKEGILIQLKKNINDQNWFVDYKGLDKKEESINDKIKFNSLDEIISLTLDNKIKHCVLKLKKNNNFLKEVAFSKSLLNVVSNYLNTKNITCKIECFISNPFKGSIDEMKKNAQYFHYDCDYKKFLKIFIYLNDIDENSGPHIFIQNTHKKKFFKHILAERIDDDEALEIYGEAKQKKFIKNAGSVIIEDTFGLHKGEIPKTKSRAMLVFEYGVGESILKNDQYFFSEFK